MGDVTMTRLKGGGLEAAARPMLGELMRAAACVPLRRRISSTLRLTTVERIISWAFWRAQHAIPPDDDDRNDSSRVCYATCDKRGGGPQQMGAFNWKVFNAPDPFTVTYRESY